MTSDLTLGPSPYLPPVADLPPDDPAMGAADADDSFASSGQQNPAAAPIDEPPSAAQLSPAEAARDNARRGTWQMDEFLSGWVLIGADGKPVMRNDGSRVAFSFHSAARLAHEFAAGRDPNANGPAERRALAPLDSRFNHKWDPQAPRSRLADRTKLAKLVAYKYAQTTEPEEAVRRAVTLVFGNRVKSEELRIDGWVPDHHDPQTVIYLADVLLRQALGPEPPDEKGTTAIGGASTATRTIRGVPLDRHSLRTDVAAASGAQTFVGSQQTPSLASQSSSGSSRLPRPKAIPLYDDNGDPVIGASGKHAHIPEDVDLHFFAEMGRADAKEGLLTVLNRLKRFKQGGLWDLQRRGSAPGTVIDELVDVSTIAIGVYAAAAGLYKHDVQTLASTYALLFSDFPESVPRSGKYFRYPIRNEKNFEIGYDLYKQGKLKLGMLYTRP